MTVRIAVARNPVSRTKVAVALSALVFLLGTHHNKVLAQSPSATTTPGAAPQPGPAAPPSPAMTTQPPAAPSPSQPAPSESPMRSRPSTQAGTRTLELTDFQQFVAQSLGYPLPIYGAGLFDNAPTTFAPVDRIPVTSNYVIGPSDEILIRAW